MSTKKGKKGKTKSKDEAKCAWCGADALENSSYCSPDCEIHDLKSQMAERDEKIARFNRRSEPVKCYGRIDWATCTQEWYSKPSFDAKRRTSELRKLGFECTAKSVGEMPIVNGDGSATPVKMTVVTCFPRSDEKGKEFRPPEPEMIDGLATLPTAE